MRINLGRIFSVIVLSIAFGASASNAGSYDNLKQSPLYRQVQSLCEPGDVEATFARLRGDYLMTSARAALAGLKAGITFGDPLAYQSAIDTKLKSDAFWLGLSDCLGDDDRGRLLIQAYTAELILADSIAYGVGWGATYLGGLALMSKVIRVLSTLPKVSLVIASYPRAFPILAKAWTYGSRGFSALSIAGIVLVTVQKKQMRDSWDEIQTTRTRIEKDNTGRAELLELSNSVVDDLKRKIRECTDVRRKREMEVVLASIEQDLASFK